MRGLYFLPVFLFSLALKGQQPLRLQEAISLGLEQNFDIRLAKTETELARDASSPGMAGFFPSLSLNLGTTMQSSNLSQKFASGLEVDRNGVGSSAVNGGLALSWLFFDGGKMFLTRKKLSRQLSAAELKLQQQVMAFADSLAASYYQVVLAGLDLKILSQSRSSVEERLRLAKEQQRIGTRPPSDALQAKMDLMQLQNRIIAQQKQVEIKKAALNLLIGRGPEIDFEPVDTVRVPELQEFSSLRQQVLEKNLQLRSQRENLEVARLGLGEIRTRMLPQLGLNMSLNYQRSSSTAGFALFNRSLGPLAGISLSLPVFNGVSVKRQLRMAGRDLEAREIQLKLAENRMLFQAWRTLKNLETWTESMENEKEVQLLARENLRIVQDRFRQGLATSMEIRDAENQLENSRIRLEQCRYQSAIAGNQLLRLSASLDAGSLK